MEAANNGDLQVVQYFRNVNADLKHKNRVSRLFREAL